MINTASGHKQVLRNHVVFAIQGQNISCLSSGQFVEIVLPRLTVSCFSSIHWHRLVIFLKVEWQINCLIKFGKVAPLNAWERNAYSVAETLLTHARQDTHRPTSVIIARWLLNRFLWQLDGSSWERGKRLRDSNIAHIQTTCSAF